MFDQFQKIELMDFETATNDEYLRRTAIVDAVRPVHEWQKEWETMNTTDGKQSPEINKKGKPRPLKSPPRPPPNIGDLIGESKVRNGITPNVLRFLEVGKISDLSAIIYLRLAGCRSHGTTKPPL